MKIKWIIFVLFFLMFLTSNLAMVDIIGGTANLIYFISTIILISLTLMKFKIDIKPTQIISLFIVTVVMLISFWINPFPQKFSFIIRLISLTFLTLFCFNNFMRKKEDYIKIVIYSGFISIIPLIVINLIVYLATGNIRGIFSNPNGLGVFASTTFLLSLLLIHFSNNLFMYFMSILSLSFGFYFTIISHSRTSFLIILIGLCVFLLAMIYSKNTKSKSFLKYFTLLLGMSFIVIKLNDIWGFIHKHIINKFQRKTMAGDVLDNRTSIWDGAFKDGSLWGHGESYFISNFGFSAHNSYIYLLGDYGYIMFILSILFTIAIFYKFLSLFIKTKKMIYFAPILFFIGFIISSMAESVLFKMNMTFVFLLLPILYSNSKKNVHNEHY